MMKPGNDANQPQPAQGYSAKWSSHDESPTRQRIRREVYGDDYPVEADPRSYVTLTELRAIAHDLRVGPGQTIIDLGCGQGGPSFWVARETGAALLGIDLSSVGIARASERAGELGVADHARFQVADLTVTRLPDASFDAAMSVDVLWAIPDKLGALREAARILKPGARFAFTNWDRDLTPPGYLPPLGDHRPLLEQAGFEVETYQVQPDAEIQRRAVYEAVVAAEQDLICEMGDEGAARLMFEAKGTLGLTDGIDYLAHSRRIYVVARNAGSSTTC
ncbi:MAG: class I SAM-dependent methyltransferase [Actinobacteria bacterium]|nr:class I SAM-dependent methyltransferase [Actinomycetota bacterium]